MKKLTLDEAFIKSGLIKQFIMEKLDYNKFYYSRFIDKKSITKEQARIIEEITRLNIDDIDIEVK